MSKHKKNKVKNLGTTKSNKFGPIETAAKAPEGAAVEATGKKAK